MPTIEVGYTSCDGVGGTVVTPDAGKISTVDTRFSNTGHHKACHLAGSKFEGSKKFPGYRRYYIRANHCSYHTLVFTTNYRITGLLARPTPRVFFRKGEDAIGHDTRYSNIDNTNCGRIIVVGEENEARGRR